jgi:hypothetical protein
MYFMAVVPVSVQHPEGTVTPKSEPRSAFRHGVGEFHKKIAAVHDLAILAFNLQHMFNRQVPESTQRGCDG